MGYVYTSKKCFFVFCQKVVYIVLFKKNMIKFVCKLKVVKNDIYCNDITM